MNSADRLCLVWSVVVLVFFSLSQSKLPGYILSVTVACGILLARLFDAALAARRAGRLVFVHRAAMAFAVVCLLARRRARRRRCGVRAVQIIAHPGCRR